MALEDEIIPAVIRTLSSASDDEWTRRVGFTPAWNVKAVAAHILVGVRRTRAGIDDPLPDVEAASLALNLAESMPSSQVIASLANDAKDIEWPTPDGGPRLSWDISVHLADILETLERPRLTSALWVPVATEAIEFLAMIGRLSASVRTPEFSAGHGPRVFDMADGYSLFRWIFGRTPAAKRSMADLSDWPSSARFFVS